ncbi:MAG: prepilin-type N-terminal cleavage/methylation domain-containing protein [bacterium]|nr:prepilin-type N-terminal cleavage/methylation domain-containing protein [bacterium]
MDNRGDTIVEVLIAVAIISLVLAVTYSTMTRNIATMRDNQERSEAARLAQGQLEALKAAWATTPGQSSVTSRWGSGFCMSGSVAVSTGSGTVTTDASLDNLTAYDPQCTSNFYSRGIRYNSTSKVFTIYTRWDRIGDGRRSETVIAYRLE